MSHRNIKEWWTSEPRAHWDVGFQWNSWNNRVSTIGIPYLLQQKLPLSQPPAVQLSLTQWTSRCRSWVVGMGAVNPKPSSIDVRAWGLQPSTGDNHPARAWISSVTWRWLCLYLSVFAISVQGRTDVRSTILQLKTSFRKFNISVWKDLFVPKQHLRNQSMEWPKIRSYKVKSRRALK